MGIPWPRSVAPWGPEAWTRWSSALMGTERASEPAGDAWVEVWGWVCPDPHGFGWWKPHKTKTLKEGLTRIIKGRKLSAHAGCDSDQRRRDNPREDGCEPPGPFAPESSPLQFAGGEIPPPWRDPFRCQSGDRLRSCWWSFPNPRTRDKL